MKNKRSFVKGQNHLLIIAINNYQGGIEPLKSAVNDARRLKKVLLERYEFQEETTKVLENETATRFNILESLGELTNTISDIDNLIVYFSGHGGKIDNTGYLIPADGIKSHESTYISQWDLKIRLDRLKCRHLVIFYDSCNSGALLFTSKKISRKNKDEARRSAYGIASSQKDQISIDGSTSTTNSPFTGGLIKILENNYSPISTLVLQDKLREQVKTDIGDRQNPVGGPLSLNWGEQGIFKFYPRRKDYEVSKAIDLLEQKKSGEAVKEILNFFNENKKLPTNYEYHFLESYVINVLIDNSREGETAPSKLYKVRDESILSTLSAIDNSAYLKIKTRHRAILNAFANFKFQHAFHLVKRIFPLDTNYIRDIQLLKFHFEIIQKWKREKVITQEFYAEELVNVLGQIIAILYGVELLKSRSYDFPAIFREVFSRNHSLVFIFPLLIFSVKMSNEKHEILAFVMHLKKLFRDFISEDRYSDEFNRFYLYLRGGILFLDKKYGFCKTTYIVDLTSSNKILHLLFEFEGKGAVFVGKRVRFFGKKSQDKANLVTMQRARLEALRRKKISGLISDKSFLQESLSVLDSILSISLRRKESKSFLFPKKEKTMLLTYDLVMSKISTDEIFYCFDILKTNSDEPMLKALETRYLLALEHFYFSIKHRGTVVVEINKIIFSLITLSRDVVKAPKKDLKKISEQEYERIKGMLLNENIKDALRLFVKANYGEKNVLLLFLNRLVRNKMEISFEAKDLERNRITHSFLLMLDEVYNSQAINS